MGGQFTVAGGAVSMSEAEELREEVLTVLASFCVGSSSWRDFFLFGVRAGKGASMPVSTGAFWSMDMAGEREAAARVSGQRDVVEGSGCRGGRAAGVRAHTLLFMGVSGRGAAGGPHTCTQRSLAWRASQHSHCCNNLHYKC